MRFSTWLLRRGGGNESHAAFAQMTMLCVILAIGARWWYPGPHWSKWLGLLSAGLWCAAAEGALLEARRDMRPFHSTYLNISAALASALAIVAATGS